MLFERIESSGLAHYSYIVGDENEAVVIDPRRDAEDYIEAARQAEMQLKYILETHRNEDYLIGSLEIARQTGAKIFHSFNESYDSAYGEDIQDGYKVNFGNLDIEALQTPIPSSLRIKLTDLPDKFDEVPDDEQLHIVCGSGVRSMVAASLLKRAGFDNLSVPLGGISGWKS